MRISIPQFDASAIVDLHSSMAPRDSWQVVDRVAGLYLGGAVNLARHREMAQSGHEILQQLAAHGHSDAAAATDYDLVQAVESWLAVTATSDHQLDEMAQPDSIGNRRVPSRFIGETEKSLNAGFEPSQPVAAVLLLDDAGALFSASNEKKDDD